MYVWLTFNRVLECDLCWSSGSCRGSHNRPHSTTTAAVPMFCRPTAIRWKVPSIGHRTAINRQSLRRSWCGHRPGSTSWLLWTRSSIHRGSELQAAIASRCRWRWLLLSGSWDGKVGGTIGREITAGCGTSLWSCNQLLTSSLLHSQLEVNLNNTTLQWNYITELRGITCHMGSHGATFSLTQVNTSHLTPAR